MNRKPLRDILNTLANHRPEAVDVEELAETALYGDASDERWDALGRLAEHHHSMAKVLEKALSLEGMYGSDHLDTILALDAPKFADLQNGEDDLRGYKTYGLVLKPVSDTDVVGGLLALETLREYTGCDQDEARRLLDSGNEVFLLSDTDQDRARHHAQILGRDRPVLTTEVVVHRLPVSDTGDTGADEAEAGAEPDRRTEGGADFVSL